MISGWKSTAKRLVAAFSGLMIVVATLVAGAAPAAAAAARSPFGYLERAIPIMILIVMGLGFVVGSILVLFRILNLPFNVAAALLSFLPMFGFLIAAITSTLREWSWQWRLGLHTGWLLGAAVTAVLWIL